MKQLRFTLMAIAVMLIAMPAGGQSLRGLGNQLKNKATQAVKNGTSRKTTPVNQKASASETATSVGGNTWYVSQETGSNRNDGSKGSPLKNIQKAIDLASPGDMIRVAEGNYYGLLNSGNIKIAKGVSIFGGYSSDFCSMREASICK